MKIKVGPELSDMYIYAKSNQKEVLVMHGFRNEYFDELLPQELKRFYGWQSKNTMDCIVYCEDPVNRMLMEGGENIGVSSKSFADNSTGRNIGF